MRTTTVRALLLAAGFGKRLQPLTDQWPKCLMPIGGRPLLEYWLQMLLISGIRDVLVNTHFHADKVSGFLARADLLGWVRSVHERELLGTAGTLRNNLDFFRDQITLLIHADNWCQCNFSDFINYHVERRPADCLITMMTFDSDDPRNCGIVETDNQGVVIAYHEKTLDPPSNRANAAVYLLQPEVLEWLAVNSDVTDFSTEVLPQFVGRIATWHNDVIHRDIGTLQALRAAQLDPLPQYNWPVNNVWQRAFEESVVFDSLMQNLLTLDNSDDRQILN
jgi:mannose-1-phosphate guanylyltransferase